uniref:Wsv427-like protein n=1 Tax=Penaeus semisulcatus majanivirus TaxID=2984274 RepID=A0A9C7F078_9VIRU|nr:MAG: wsv427-like protein [Penaeus semisulcatus majanivirus]
MFNNRIDTYTNRARDLLAEINNLEYVLANNPSLLPSKEKLHTPKDEESQLDETRGSHDESVASSSSSSSSSIFYKPECDLSLANVPLSEMVNHLTPLRATIGARVREYVDCYGSLKKGIKISDALKNIWRDIIDFSFTASNNIVKETVTNRLVNVWRDTLKGVQDHQDVFSNITEKRRSSVLILLRVIERIIDANMQYSQHFVKDALLCRLIRGATCSLNVKDTGALPTVMRYIPLCTETSLQPPPPPSSSSASSSSLSASTIPETDTTLEYRIKGVYGYGDFHPRCEDDHKIALRDICSDYFLKLLFEFLLSPHIHSTWRETYLIAFVSSALKLIRNHEPFILALGKKKYQQEQQEQEEEQQQQNTLDEQQTEYNCKKYFDDNIDFTMRNPITAAGCHPFVFLPTATDFWSFCKNGQPVYNVRNVLVNARPSSFPPICGGPAGVSQGKQLAWERYCRRQGVSDHGCECVACNRRNFLVDRVRQRIGQISGETRVTDVTKWHQGTILMITFYAFTGLLAHRNYASDMDDKADFFKNLITAIEKSHYMKSNDKLITSGGGESDTSNILHTITFGVEEEFRQKLKSPQKKPIFITASIDDDILEGDNISRVQLTALRNRRVSEFNCWF